MVYNEGNFIKVSWKLLLRIVLHIVHVHNCDNYSYTIFGGYFTAFFFDIPLFTTPHYLCLNQRSSTVPAIFVRKVVASSREMITVIACRLNASLDGNYCFSICSKLHVWDF